jgi:hypothetical protein
VPTHTADYLLAVWFPIPPFLRLLTLSLLQFTVFFLPSVLLSGRHWLRFIPSISETNLVPRDALLETYKCNDSENTVWTLQSKIKAPIIELIYFYSNCICEISCSKFISVLKRRFVKISRSDKTKHHSLLLSELHGEWIVSRSDHLTPGETCPSVGLTVAKKEIPAPVRYMHAVMAADRNSFIWAASARDCVKLSIYLCYKQNIFDISDFRNSFRNLKSLVLKRPS